MKQAVQLGFYIGAGFGLAIGSGLAVLMGSNLVWQSGGLVAGALLGICGGLTISWMQRRLKPAPTPAYRPSGT
ncbi:hypothetical protein C5Y96_13260 [Blastopirellula marina]|uniref:Uncharacterized protein n=1 Tax=Blastopirellula marina TaxID=124 RepID=A0A2S8FHC1_9BACT|nr:MULTISPECIES: hypothetical protein [Pirellulaceae]PQO31304.1 hypothetical protein C5Y96_13260 [Blastopirellula marina]RCS51698.1 hypothetical protein DTL36_13270 [Bremerella cremea]